MRGLFGRGLKEAIIGLGKGEIRTVRDRTESSVEIFTENRTPKYRVVRKARPVEDIAGTRVTIEVQSSKIRCPKFDILYRLVFDRPEGKELPPQTLRVEGFGTVKLCLFESDARLYFGAGDPSSVAGILVKTEGAILDSRLFGFDAEDAAQYFFGYVDCPGIAAKLRAGDFGILDPNRSGLDWRHQSCRSLDAAVKDAIRPIIYAKRDSLESKGGPRLKSQYREKLAELCKLLNSLVESELEDLPDWGLSGTEINTLVVRPEVGYTEPNQPRNFGVYVPERLLKTRNIEEKATLELVDAKGAIQLSHDALDLEPAKKHAGLLSAKFSKFNFSEATTRFGPRAICGGRRN